MRLQISPGQKKIISIIGFWIVVMTGLGFLGYFVFNDERSPAAGNGRPSGTAPKAGAAAIDENTGSLLNKYAGELQRLDEQLAGLVINPDGKTAKAEDVLIRLKNQEYVLEKILDTLEGHREPPDQLLGSFRSLLAGHRAMSRLSNFLGSGGEQRPGAAEGLSPAAKRLLQDKDDRIAGLEQRLNSQAALPNGEDKAIGKDRPGDHEKKVQVLQEQVDNLRHTNETLQLRLKQAQSAKTPEEEQPSALASQKAELQRRTSELTDELRFAQVDCNLSRADARQIIYNSRQRKELLTDALTTLNQLAGSEDPEIQKKAREKIAMLRNIAAAVHD